MNKLGAATMLVILLSVCYFIFGMVLYQFLKPDVTLARAGLECSSPDTPGDMITCLIVDSVIPLAIIGILSVAGGYATGKIL